MPVLLRLLQIQPRRRVLPLKRVMQRQQEILAFVPFSSASATCRPTATQHA